MLPEGTAECVTHHERQGPGQRGNADLRAIGPANGDLPTRRIRRPRWGAKGDGPAATAGTCFELARGQIFLGRADRPASVGPWSRIRGIKIQRSGGISKGGIAQPGNSRFGWS